MLHETLARRGFRASAPQAGDMVIAAVKVGAPVEGGTDPAVAQAQPGAVAAAPPRRAVVNQMRKAHRKKLGQVIELAQAAQGELDAKDHELVFSRHACDLLAKLHAAMSDALQHQAKAFQVQAQCEAAAAAQDAVAGE